MRALSFSCLPEEILYLPEFAVEAVVHIDVLHLFCITALLPFSVSILFVEVGGVVQVKLGDHIQTRPG